MFRIVASTRREAVSEVQAAALADLMGQGGTDWDFVKVPVVWKASDDPDADLSENMRLWWALFRHTGREGVVAGDFPHAALEALSHMRSLHPNPAFPKVFVRIYKIGGGFQRDMEYLRWAVV